MSQTNPIIQISNLSKSFLVGGQPVQILKDISLSVDPGEMVAITGPSGNGKSTTLNMITGIDRPSSGEVVVNNAPVHKMSESQLAVWRGENMGIIFQFFQLLPSLSLAQNVALPMELARKYKPAERRACALELLDLVELADQADKLPGTVSGGQQQRAAIARALANDPPLTAADEPTGNLDAVTAESVFVLFQQLVQARKTIGRRPTDIDVYLRELDARITGILQPAPALRLLYRAEIFTPAAARQTVER